MAHTVVMEGAMIIELPWAVRVAGEGEEVMILGVGVGGMIPGGGVPLLVEDIDS